MKRVGILVFGLIVSGYAIGQIPQPGDSADGTGTESADGTGLESADGTGLESADGTGLDSADGTGLESADGTGLESADGTGLESADGTGLESADGTGLESGTSYTVKANDTLGSIAAAVYGDSSRWKEIYDANSSKIADANVIEPGTVLVIPQSN